MNEITTIIKTKLPYIKFSKCFFFKFNNKIWKLQATNFHFSVFKKFFSFIRLFIYFRVTHILWTIYDFQDILFLHEKWKPQAINFHFLFLFFDLFSFFYYYYFLIQPYNSFFLIVIIVWKIKISLLFGTMKFYIKIIW